MKSYKEYLEETRSSLYNYKDYNKSGRPTTDPDKVTKVVAAIRDDVVDVALQEVAVLVHKQKELTDKLNELKPEIRQYVKDLFDAADESKTRVVETKEVVAQISRATERTTIDYKKFVEELRTHLTGMEKFLDELLEKYTKVTQVAESFSISLKEEKEDEGLAKKIRRVIGAVVNRGKTLFKRVDKFLEKWKAVLTG